MNLHNVRANVRLTLKRCGLSQKAFAEKHALSDSWLNKFLCGKHDPRHGSLEKLERAIEQESGERLS